MSLPSGRRARRQHDRRQRVYRVALQLFARQGFEATRVEQICRRADVAKGTFFCYYPNKRAVLADYYRALDSRFFEWIAALDPLRPERSLGAYFTRAERALRAEGRLGRVLIEALAAEPDLGVMDRASGAEVERRVTVFLAAAAEHGALRADLDAALAASVLSDLWSSTLRAWVQHDQSFGLARVLRTKLRLLLAGLQAPAAAAPSRRRRAPRGSGVRRAG